MSKIMKYISLLFLAVFLSTGCSHNLTSKKVVTHTKSDVSKSEMSEWNRLIGKWYGNQKTSEGSAYEWTVNRESDGRYQIHFKITKKKGKSIDRIEVGEWGASGGIYFTIFKGWLVRGNFVPNDSQDPSFRDSYKIISLDDKKFTYESLSNHQVFSVERVSDSYELK